MIKLSDELKQVIVEKLQLERLDERLYRRQTVSNEQADTFVEYLWIAQVRENLKYATIIGIDVTTYASHNFDKKWFEQLLLFHNYKEESYVVSPVIKVDEDVIVKVLKCVPIVGLPSLMQLDGGPTPDFSIVTYADSGMNTFNFYGEVKGLPVENLWLTINRTIRSFVNQCDSEEIRQAYQEYIGSDEAYYLYNPLAWISIIELDLSTHALNPLQNIHLSTIADVLEMVDRGHEALLAISHFDEQALEELMQKLREKGYLPPAETQA